MWVFVLFEFLSPGPGIGQARSVLVPSRCLRACVLLLNGWEAAAMNSAAPHGAESTAAALHSGNKATVARETFSSRGKNKQRLERECSVMLLHQPESLWPVDSRKPGTVLRLFLKGKNQT